MLSPYLALSFKMRRDLISTNSAPSKGSRQLWWHYLRQLLKSKTKSIKTFFEIPCRRAWLYQETFGSLSFTSIPLCLTLVTFNHNCSQGYKTLIHLLDVRSWPWLVLWTWDVWLLRFSTFRVKAVLSDNHPKLGCGSVSCAVLKAIVWWSYGSVQKEWTFLLLF